MSRMESTAELNKLLESWESEYNSGADSLSTLTKIAELVERETEAFMKMDPDPFDDRHPFRSNPDCALGHVLKALLKNDDFINRLINNYLLHRENRDLNVVSARLLLDILPCLEVSVVFQERDGLVDKLFQWAEHASPPLQTYAAGLLAPAMELPEIASTFRDKNAHLVPLLLKRLHNLAEKDKEKKKELDHPFAHFSQESNKRKTTECSPQRDGEDLSKKKMKVDYSSVNRLNIPPGGSLMSPPRQKSSVVVNERKSIESSMDVNLDRSFLNDCSGSSWQEVEQFVIGSFQMHPLTSTMEQRLILQYLTPMGEYQELLSNVFELNAVKLILQYINLKQNSDIRLAFEALKYLASLLCHKKLAMEFINNGGLQKLLQVPRPSIAATGVSVCLYYLAYSEDAMEWVCMLPRYILSELVRYVLWLLECSHESSRSHATMFFGLTFNFKILHELFDEQDGLRKLVNVISTLPILDDDLLLSDDAVFVSRQQARHVIAALKKYYETHLAVMAEHLRRTHSRNQGGSPQPSPQLSKSVRYDSSLVSENIEVVLELMPLRMRWRPVDELHKLCTVKLLIQIIGMAGSWNFSGRADTVKSALDVLNVCSVMPRTQFLLTETIEIPGQTSSVGMSTILSAAEGEIVSDPDVMKSALNVIINCVCGPASKMGIPSSKSSVNGSAKKKSHLKHHEDLLSKMWNCVRVNNGIMILLNLFEIKTPITSADSIRALACKAMVGLVRSDTMSQILGKLPLFTNGTLQVLMQEPVLQDKRQEHVKFCKHALKLIERVTGKPMATRCIETSIDKIHKADVVAQTKIVYKEKELVQLIYQHLVNKGLPDSAKTLLKEAGLHKNSNPSLSRTMKLHSSPSPILKSSPVGVSSPRKSSISQLNKSSNLTPRMTNGMSVSSNASPMTSTSITSTPGSSNGNAPIKINFSKSRHNSFSDKIKAKSCVEANGKYNMNIQKNKTTSWSAMNITSPTSRRHQSSCYRSSPIMTPSSVFTAAAITSNVTLDRIVTEYLREQHSLCRNPVVTCPPFDLFRPHRCPEPMFRNTAPCNVAARTQRRPYFPRFGGPDGHSLDIRHIYSRFRLLKSCRDSDQSSSFTCCSFSACDQYIILGTFAGELKLFNVQTGLEEETYSCHESEITHCESSKDGTLYLTSSLWRRPLSALWSTGSSLEMKYSFDNETYMEFCKLVQDRIVGTTYDQANIYDVNTGKLLTKLKDSDISNNYTKNKATFNPTDEFVLSDGILWDSHNSVVVHKFDKFNSHTNGVFHPNGLEIISNSEVWDVRTFHLLKTVPALDQCRITFSNNGDVIYGAIMEDDVELEEDEMKSPYGSSFRTFSAHDYSNIATIDIKKNIYDLCTNKYDTYLAIIENQGDRNVIPSSESICRLYEVGKLKESDDDEIDEEDEDEDDVDDDDDGSDDDDDDEDDYNNEDGDGNNDHDRSSLLLDSDDQSSEWSTEDDDEDDDSIRFALAES